MPTKGKQNWRIIMGSIVVAKDANKMKFGMNTSDCTFAAIQSVEDLWFVQIQMMKLENVTYVELKKRKIEVCSIQQ